MLIFAGWLSLSLLDERVETKIFCRAGNVSLSDQLIGMSLVWGVLKSMHSQIPNLGQHIPSVTEKNPLCPIKCFVALSASWLFHRIILHACLLTGRKILHLWEIWIIFWPCTDRAGVKAITSQLEWDEVAARQAMRAVPGALLGPSLLSPGLCSDKTTGTLENSCECHQCHLLLCVASTVCVQQWLLQTLSFPPL